MLAERGAPWTPADYQLAHDILADFRTANADQLVLGCTHFAFIMPLIQQGVGAHVTIVDPAPAVARQVERVLHDKNLLAPADQNGHTLYLTTGNLAEFERQIHTLLGIDAPETAVIHWQGEVLSDSRG
jgi:glutamate racemase